MTQMPSDHMLRIAIYSPDTTVKSLLASALKPAYAVLTDFDYAGLKALLNGQNNAVDVLILDFDSNISPLQDQLAVYDDVGETSVPVVVMTDDLRRSTAIEFLRRGAFDCIRKPPSLIELKVIVGRAYEHAQMKRELSRTTQTVARSQTCDQLLGSSSGTLVVYDLIRRVADLSASVLITGESGTGKELVARAIHNIGNRASHPFVAVSCGAIPETLVEAELFGHERGAYTGSIGTRAGYLEQAGNGTLFLDEIGELSPTIQVKLLRVLQQREFLRLGSNRLIPLNARILFATHRDLSAMIEEGSFRKDLYYRVNVMNIQVPPLRERTEDIPVLANHFLRQYAAEYGKDIDDIRPNVMQQLIDYDWPGNVRELENVIQGAVIRADESSICLTDLPEHLRASNEEVNIEQTDFDFLLRQFKINLVSRTVGECNGNKTLAARKLGLSRAYIHRLMRGMPVSEAIAFPESA